MRVMPDQILVKPDVPKQSALIMEAPEPTSGFVCQSGTENVKVDEKIIFGDDYDKLELTLNGEQSTFLIMHYTNIKLVL